jgi:hypothetical protein
MDPKTLQPIVDRAQYDFLPIIYSSLAAVLVLTLLRDIFTRESAMAPWVIAYYVIWFAIIVATGLARQLGKVSPRWSHVLALLCLSGFLVNPAVSILQGSPSGPLYLAASLFAAGLVSLSIAPLLIAQFISLIVFTISSLPRYGAAETLPVLLIAIIACAFALILVQRRIGTIVKIFQLESRVEALESILPMCSGCKKTRDEDGNWLAVEDYLETRDEGLQVSHGLCPDCKEANYGDLLRNRAARQEQSGSAD